MNKFSILENFGTKCMKNLEFFQEQNLLYIYILNEFVFRIFQQQETRTFDIL